MPEFVQSLSNQERIVILCFCMWKLDFSFTLKYINISFTTLNNITYVIYW